jgi:MoxR-like ATPase
MAAFEAKLERARDASAKLQAAIGETIVGQTEIVRQTLWGLIAGGHVLLEGVPGLGKTLLVRTLSHCLDLQFSRIQFTPDLMPSDVTGTNILVTDERGERRFALSKGPVFTQVLLADEINRSPPKTQAALLEAMQEQQVTVEGTSFELPDPYMVVATQNPIDLEGTYPLPEAQIDRFLVRVGLGYPPRADEAAMLMTHHADRPTAKAVVEPERLRQLLELARRVHVEPDL